MDASSIIINLTMILVGIGLYFTVKSTLLWRKTNIAGIGIEVTKNKSFLQDNFLLVLFIGAFTGTHVFIDFLKLTIVMEAPYIETLHFMQILTLLAIMFVLSILSFKWYKLLSKINQWDKRWISGKKQRVKKTN